MNFLKNFFHCLRTKLNTDYLQVTWTFAGTLACINIGDKEKPLLKDKRFFFMPSAEPSFLPETPKIPALCGPHLEK
jgi:hypothetical protein